MNTFNFTPFPVLETGRLILRKVCHKDTPEIFKIRSDKDLARYLDRPLYTKFEEADNFINKILAGISNNEWLYWVLTLRESDKCIGTICLWKLSQKYRRAEVGFELMTEYQRKGYMTEALEAVLDYGFDCLELNYIDGEVDPNNIASVNLMVNHGFRRIAPEEYDPGENCNPSTLMYRLSEAVYYRLKNANTI